MSDHYSVLGISRDAEDVVIKAAWRALAQKYHPDKFAGAAELSQEKMREINIAYAVLSDRELKAEYDRWLDENERDQFSNGGGSCQANAPDETDLVPDSVKGWSWGAFLLNFIWAIGNRTWIGLFAIVPYLGLIVAIVLGFKGREWAWKNKRWKSVEHFNEVQKKWSFWGVAITVGLFSIGMVAAVLIPALGENGKQSEPAETTDKISAAGNSGVSGSGQGNYADVFAPREELPKAQVSQLQSLEPDEFSQVVLYSIRTYPFLDHESANANVQAINDVVARRDYYASHGYSLAAALKRAVDEVAPLYVEGSKSIIRQKTHGVPATKQPTWYEQQDARLNGCQPKAVMSEEDIAKCRNRR